MSDSARLVWQVPPRNLAQKVRDYFRRLMNALYSLGQYFAAQMETFAKQRAPWTDRSGHARQGLTARAFKAASAITILLFGTMSYQVYLETKNAGRFAIILPTLRIYHPQVMAAMQALVKG